MQNISNHGDEVPLLCTVCLVEFSGIECAREHFKPLPGSNHSKRLEMKNAILSTSAQFSCKTCWVATNSPEQLKQHITSSKHIKKVQTALRMGVHVDHSEACTDYSLVGGINGITNINGVMNIPDIKKSSCSVPQRCNSSTQTISLADQWMRLVEDYAYNRNAVDPYTLPIKEDAAFVETGDSDMITKVMGISHQMVGISGQQVTAQIRDKLNNDLVSLQYQDFVSAKAVLAEIIDLVTSQIDKELLDCDKLEQSSENLARMLQIGAAGQQGVDKVRRKGTCYTPTLNFGEDARPKITQNILDLFLSEQLPPGCNGNRYVDNV